MVTATRCMPPAIPRQIRNLEPKFLTFFNEDHVLSAFSVTLSDNSCARDNVRAAL